MALSMEQKLFYHDMINIIWQNSIGDNNVNNISEAVAEDVDKVLYEIQNCSKTYDAIKTLFDFIYEVKKPSTWFSLVAGYGMNAVTSQIDGWLSALMKSPQYKACVVTAAANWKSKIVLGLIGL